VPGDAAKRIARWRVPAGFTCAAVVLWLAQPTPRSLAAGALVAMAGEAVRIWAAGHLEKGREVTQSGPYRFTRHPLYLGSTILGAGLAIACASWIVGVLTAGYLAVTLTAAIHSEEAYLTDKFGPAYPAYRRGAGDPAPRTFSAARAIANREYRAALGVVAALVLLAWKAWLFR
jgi:protein-S-isoprenylcysteine O-methyltransferase Ste14